MLPGDLIQIKEAAAIFGVSPVVLHRAKLLGQFRAWPRELGRHYASLSELREWFEIYRAVKPKHKEKAPKKCRGFEVLPEAVYDAGNPRPKLRMKDLK